MSSVTIKDLYWEINQDRYANNVWMDYKDIEVVPRKMVEMIIAKCESDRENLDLTYTFDRGRNCEAEDIKRYAESLLEKFEEDGKV